MINAQHKIAEAKAKGFVKNAVVYSLHYPKSRSVIIDDNVHTKHGYNLLWVKAKTGFGLIMDIAICDLGQDKWAEFTPPPTVVKKEIVPTNNIQVKKGDIVKFKDGDNEHSGTIVRYPSNSGIVIDVNNTEYVVNKLNIMYVISKAK